MMRRYRRDVDVHGLVRFSTSFLFNESGSEALDLYTSPCFLLDMFDEHALRAHYFGSDIEIAYGFQSDSQLGFRPFTLKENK